MSALKYDNGKPRLDLLSQSAMRGLGDVLGYGAKKYDPQNWRKGMEWSRMVAAALRHLLAFNEGQDNDDESGLPHIDHAMCCLMFLSEYQKRNLGTDDRYKPVNSYTKDPQPTLKDVVYAPDPITPTKTASASYNPGGCYSAKTEAQTAAPQQGTPTLTRGDL